MGASEYFPSGPTPIWTERTEPCIWESKRFPLSINICRQLGGTWGTGLVGPKGHEFFDVQRNNGLMVRMPWGDHGDAFPRVKYTVHERILVEKKV